MRVSTTLQAMMLALLIGTGARAQIINKVNEAGNTVTAATNTISSTTQNINTAKSVINSLFGGKGKNTPTVAFAIGGIDYSDANLDNLKTAINKVKGVKKVITNYKDGTATIVVPYKGSVTELWDAVSAKEKQLFKLMLAQENTIVLEYQLKASNTSTTQATASKPGGN
ncbi:MAG: hypothetical protein J7621_12975 [Niastella sp.]|nr:hypothetical protein [Niastella sp.]